MDIQYSNNLCRTVCCAGKVLRSSDANVRLFGLVGIRIGASDETFHVLE